MENKNKPAFPSVSKRAELDGTIYYDGFGGLTKRELFAAMAMMGHRASDMPGFTHPDRQALAKAAVSDADALLAELEKGSEK